MLKNLLKKLDKRIAIDDCFIMPDENDSFKFAVLSSDKKKFKMVSTGNVYDAVKISGNYGDVRYFIFDDDNKRRELYTVDLYMDKRQFEFSPELSKVYSKVLGLKIATGGEGRFGADNQHCSFISYSGNLTENQMKKSELKIDEALGVVNNSIEKN